MQPIPTRTLARAALAAAFGLATGAQAASTGWVLNTNQTLALVTLASNTSVLVGSTFFPSDSLAVTPAGQLLSADPAGNLWNVTAAPLPAGSTGRTQIGDLDWAPGGLWGYSNASQELFFYSFSSASVTVSLTVPLPPGQTVTGVAHEPTSGDIYLASHAVLNGDQLWRVPASSSTALAVGPLAHTDGASYVADIDFDAAGTLYAVTWFNRYVYTVAPSSALLTPVSTGPHSDTTALALTPVPEPGGAALWAAGLLAYAALRRRRHRG